MFFARWRKWLRDQSKRSTPKPRRKPGRRLLLENLEDRLAPAALTWSGANFLVDTNWSDNLNWVGNVAPVVGDTLVFPTAASSFASTDDFTGVNNNFLAVEFQGVNYTISGSGAANPLAVSFILNAGANNSFDTTLPLTPLTDISITSQTGLSFTVNGTLNLNGHNLSVGVNTLDPVTGVHSEGGGTVTLGGVVSDSVGTGQLFMQGGKLLLTNAANSYGGGATVSTTVSGGILAVGADHALGNVPAAEGTNIVLNRGTLQFTSGFSLNGNRDISLGASGGTLATQNFNDSVVGKVVGGGALTVTGSGGKLVLFNNNNTYSGGTTVSGTLTIGADGALGTPPAVEGTNVTLNGGTLQFFSSFNLNANRDITIASGNGTIDTGGNDTTVSSVINGPGNLAKAGFGTLSVLNTNTYGDTTINGGTLFVGATGSLHVTRTVTINPGATLSGNGSVGNIVAFGGTVLVPSGGSAVLTAVSADFSQAGILSTFVTGTNYNAGTDYGQLNLGAGTFTMSGTSTINLDITGLGASGTAHIATYGNSASTGFPTTSLHNNPDNFFATGLSFGPPLDVTLTDVPLAVNDSAVTNENVAVTTSVLANDKGLLNKPITVTIVTQGTKGTAVVNANNTVTYTPNLEATGSDSYQYTITDSLGQTSMATVIVTINVVNSQPVITAPGSQSTPEGSALVFSTGNGNAITLADTDGDPTGTSMHGTVSVSHGTLTILGTTSATLNIQGTVAGVNNLLNGMSYNGNAGFAGSDTLVVTATDTGNVGPALTATSLVPITVNNVAPTMTAPAVIPSPNEGSSASFNLGTFSDPGQDGPWAVDVNWGDSTAHTTFTVNPATLPPSNASLGAQSHTYDTAGNFTVTDTVTDNNGASASTTFPVTVDLVAPTATLANNGPATEGSTTTTVTFSNQSHPSATERAAGFHYAYDFNNDGNFTDPGEIGDGSYAGSSTSASVTVPEQFVDEEGNVTVRARIIDQEGAFTDYTTTITVNTVQPTPKISGAPASSNRGTAINLNGSATSPSNADTAAGFTFAWTVKLNNNTVASGSGANFSFTPGVPGNYIVTLTATDDGNVTASTQVTVVVSNPLTGNAAYVQTLYFDFLKRLGDLSSPNDAGSWVNALNASTLTPQQVASGIARSPEALGVLVDGLYLKILNRASDSIGRTGFVSFLQQGGTVEQAIIAMVTSPEYSTLTGGSDTGFVQSLYNTLLGRVASPSELAGWLSGPPPLGRAGVANAFLQSAEFRGDVVQELYGFMLAPARSVVSLFANLLHRTSAPAGAEINNFNNWVNSGLPIYTIEIAIAGSAEFVALASTGNIVGP